MYTGAADGDVIVGDARRATVEPRLSSGRVPPSVLAPKTMT
jgi:hypothetical protein